MSELMMKRVRVALICLGIVLIAVPFILSLSTRSLSLTQAPPASGDSEEVTIGDTLKNTELTPQEQRALSANLVIKSKSLRLVTQQDVEDYQKRAHMLRSRTFHMGTHLFTVVVGYKGKKPSWWGDPNGSVMVQSDYVLHKGKTRPMAVRWTMPIDYDPVTKKGHSEYDAQAKVYRSSYAIDIPEAQDASPSTYAGELKMIYRGYVPGQDKGVKFSVPVPRIPKGKKTGSG